MLNLVQFLQVSSVLLGPWMLIVAYYCQFKISALAHITERGLIIGFRNSILMYVSTFDIDQYGVYLLCRLPALAEATYRDHFCRLVLSSASASQKNSVTFFSGTTQASFLIFGTEHQYGELYCVMHF